MIYPKCPIVDDQDIDLAFNIYFTEVEPAPCIPSARLTVAVFAYIMGICNYLMRANLSVAIVCMNSDSFALVSENNHSLQNGTFDNGFLNGTQDTSALEVKVSVIRNIPDSKVHGAYMGPTWGRQDPGGSHVGPMSLAYLVCYTIVNQPVFTKKIQTCTWYFENTTWLLIINSRDHVCGRWKYIQPMKIKSKLTRYGMW